MTLLKSLFIGAVASLIPLLASAADNQVIYLVRHAEKQLAEGDKDPALTAAGTARAQLLAQILRDAQITEIFSTDYQRTRQTAEPLANNLGLPVADYNPRDLPGLVKMLQSSTGRILVVGHSNTTPQLVALLGGEPGAEIDEATEYDRLYILVLQNGSATTLLQRYGSAALE